MLTAGAFRTVVARAKLASVGLEDGTYAAANLLPPDPQGVPWDRHLAAGVFSAWAGRLASYGTVYLAGARVLAASGHRGPLSGAVGREVTLESGLVVVPLPHPSGLSRWWNDRSNVTKLRRTIMRRETCRG